MKTKKPKTRTETIKDRNAKLVITREGRKRKYFTATLEGVGSYACREYCDYIDDPMPYYPTTERETIYDVYRKPSNRKVGAYFRWARWLADLCAFDVSVRCATCFYFDMTAKLKIKDNLYHVFIGPGGISIRPIDKNLEDNWAIA